MAPVTHAKVVVTTDDPAVEVGSDEWNADHVVSIPFTGLTDVPSSYSGQGSKVVSVNAGATALEFTTPSATAISSALSWVRPQDYYANAGLVANETTAITGTDITNNPQWIGTYKVGTYWNYVALQEAIYGAMAHVDSTPGNVVWNRVNSRKNKVLYIPPGSYKINHRLLLVAVDFNVIFAGRGLATITTRTGFKVTGDSHTSTTIDNISSAVTATLDVNDEYFLAGPGVIEGTKVSAIGSTSLTLDAPTTSSVTGQQWYLYCAGWLCDSAAYGSFHHLTMSCEYTMPRTAFNDDAGASWTHGSATAPFVLDWDGAHGGLKTQQLTFYEPRIFGNTHADVGFAIGSGGASQGDTILILNPYISGCNREGFCATGANALSITILNGDIQGCFPHGLRGIGGASLYVDGTSFQVGGFNNAFSPAAGHIPNLGADIHLAGGAGASSTSHISRIRSEGTISVVAHSESSPTVDNFASSQVESVGRFNTFPFKLGHWITSGTGTLAAPSRVFMCVDCGGPNIWYAATPATNVNTVTLTSPAPSFTVNQWVGKSFFFRFGSNGFTQELGPITANTSNTVTYTGTPCSPSLTSRIFIGGKTAGSSPSAATFDAATIAKFQGVPVGAAQGFDCVAGSANVHIGSSVGAVSVGDYVVIPNADILGATMAEAPADFETRVPPIRCPLIARVITDLGSLNYALDKTAKFTQAESPGWHGTATVTDGDIKWMPIPIYNFTGCFRLEKCLAPFGVTQCNGVQQLRSVPVGTPWLGSVPTVTQIDNRNLTAGQIIQARCADLDPSVTPLDISSNLTQGQHTLITPTQDMTLTASNLPTASMTGGVQDWMLTIVTSGVTSYTITFGTGFRSAGTLATGTVTSKVFILKFLSIGSTLYEMSRTTAL